MEPGLCMCGCGGRTTIAKKTSTAKGQIKGQPCLWVHGHGRRKSGLDYVIDSETGCWIWQRCSIRLGYGMAFNGTRVVPAHVFVYEKLIGPVPAGCVLDHTCRNPPCVNPGHMDPVTQAVNVQRGLLAKLTRPEVDEIRLLHPGVSATVLAERYGVKRCTIYDVVNRRTWL